MEDADYFREMDNLIGNVPTPPAPAHLPVLEKAQFWKTSGLITAAAFETLRTRLRDAARGSRGAGGSSAAAAPIPPQPAPSPPVVSEPINVDEPASVPLREPKKAKLSQAQLVFGRTMTVASPTTNAAALPLKSCKRGTQVTTHYNPV